MTGLSWIVTIRIHCKPSGRYSCGKEICVWSKRTFPNKQAVPTNQGLGKNFGQTRKSRSWSRLNQDAKGYSRRLLCLESHVRAAKMRTRVNRNVRQRCPTQGQQNCQTGQRFQQNRVTCFIPADLKVGDVRHHPRDRHYSSTTRNLPGMKCWAL